MFATSMSTDSKYTYNSDSVSFNIEKKKKYVSYLKLILNVFKFHTFRLDCDSTRFDL